MWKSIRKFARGSLARGILGSIGGAAVAAIGWKLASDLYDAVKKRVAAQPSEEVETEPGEFKQ
jgi:hypothetical protein